MTPGIYEIEENIGTEHFFLSTISFINPKNLSRAQKRLAQTKLRGNLIYWQRIYVIFSFDFPTGLWLHCRRSFYDIQDWNNARSWMVSMIASNAGMLSVIDCSHSPIFPWDRRDIARPTINGGHLDFQIVVLTVMQDGSPQRKALDLDDLTG